MVSRHDLFQHLYSLDVFMYELFVYVYIPYIHNLLKTKFLSNLFKLGLPKLNGA